MKEQLISYETAKLAKEKGLDIPCRYSINKFQEKEQAQNYIGYDYFDKSDIDNAKENGYEMCLCPTQSLLQKWLRGKHQIDLWMDIWGENSEFYHIEDITRGIGKDRVIIGSGREGSTNYEEALEEGLYNALKLIK